MVTTKKLKMEEGQHETIVNDEESADAEEEEGDASDNDHDAEDDDHDSEDYDSEEEDSDAELMQNLMNTIKETREENKRLTDTLIQISQDKKQQGETTEGNKEAMFGQIMALAGANASTAGTTTNGAAAEAGAEATTKPPSEPTQK